jgi:hypothetical protein
MRVAFEVSGKAVYHWTSVSEVSRVGLKWRLPRASLGRESLLVPRGKAGLSA